MDAHNRFSKLEMKRQRKHSHRIQQIINARNLIRLNILKQLRERRFWSA